MSGPITYHEASTGSIVDQMARYRQLAEHDALAGAIAIGKARGTYEPNGYVNEHYGDKAVMPMKHAGDS